jgi:hypothetical protein
MVPGLIKALVIMDLHQAALLQVMLVRLEWTPGACPPGFIEHLEAIAEACERALQAGMNPERCEHLQRWAVHALSPEEEL